MWNLPGAEIKPMFPALAGRFLTIGPPPIISLVTFSLCSSLNSSFLYIGPPYDQLLVYTHPALTSLKSLFGLFSLASARILSHCFWLVMWPSFEPRDYDVLLINSESHSLSLKSGATAPTRLLGLDMGKKWFPKKNSDTIIMRLNMDAG